MAETYDIVIIGAGPSAAGVVAGVRESDADACIGVFGAESSPPVYRPDLSKALWLEEGKRLEDSFLLSGDAAADLHLGVEVTAIDTATHTITLASGTTAEYGRLVIATGSDPVRLGATTGPRILTYRESADYNALRAVATPGTHAVIIGGGYIGAELASALVQNDVRVTMVMPEEFVQERMFPPALGAKVTQGFRDRGVEIIRGMFDSASGDDDGARVRLTGGTEIAGDVVVLGLGVTPRTGLAEAAGVEVDGGIVVDERLRTSAQDVYAVGDVASYPDALLGRRRVEHIDNAETMGRVAGRILAGQDTRYDHTPYFWSDLFADGYEAIGELDASLDTVVDWNKEETAAVVYYVGREEHAGQVRGVLLWNTWDSVPKAEALIRETRDAPVTAPADLRGRIPAG